MSTGEDKTADIIHLNVGGRRFSTSRETLQTGVAKGSMLCALVSKQSLPTVCDELGYMFIDRDGDRFGVLLNYLRSASLHIVGDRIPCEGVPAGFVILEHVLEEARFFGLDPLVTLLQYQIDQIALEQKLFDEFQKQHCRLCLHHTFQSHIEDEPTNDYLGMRTQGYADELRCYPSRNRESRGGIPACNVHQFTLDADF